VSGIGADATAAPVGRFWDWTLEILVQGRLRCPEHDCDLLAVVAWGLGFAGTATLYAWLRGVPLGVSGLLERSILGSGRKTEAGPAAGGGCGVPKSASAPTSTSACFGSETPTPERLPSLVFGVSMMVGGALAGWVGGQGWGNLRMAPEFHRFFGDGWAAVAVLFGGGILVGFGTRWSGGCTSGHGLSGCGRLQVPSLVATGTYFWVTIPTSLLLERILR